MKNFARASLLLGVGLLGATPTLADEFHYNNLLIGERASGMGGAYTAISDDATGLYYNPAGIAYVGDKNFSASVNAFYSQSKRYENAIGNQPFIRNSSALLANFFGIVKPMGGFKVGFSFAVPDAVSENQNQVFDNVSTNTQRLTFNLSNRDTTNLFGPSVAVEVNDSTAIGLTLYAHKRDVQLIINQFLERTDLSNLWINKYYLVSEWGMRPTLGIAWAPVEKVSLGLSLSKTMVLSSSTSIQDTCFDSRAGGCAATTTVPSVRVPNLTDATYRRTYPIRTALGIAYFASNTLLLSADMVHHTPVTDPNFGDKVATTNFAIGAEYYLSKKWALRMGAYTNNANTPAIQAGVTNIEERINIYGASMSLTNFTGDTSVTVGGSLNYGRGQSQITSDTSVQNATTSGWLLFLSSSY